MLITSLIIAALSFGVSSSPSPATPAHDIQVFDFEGFQEYVDAKGDKTLVLNFWATWCVPCVKELPYFEEATSHYDRSEVEVILVSLDFEHQIDSRLVPFMEKHDLRSEVIVLDDPDANSWIDKVSPKWSGAIPATLVKKGKEKSFYEQSFHSFEEIQNIIQPFLKS